MCPGSYHVAVTLATPVAATRLPEPIRRAARKMFLSGERFDMRALADRAGVGRSTLYRYAGDREQLIGEVLWEMAEQIMIDARAAARGTPSQRVVHVMTTLIDVIVANHGLNEFLRREPDVALRVLTSRHGIVQRRVIDHVARLLQEELGDPTDIAWDDLAYALVRVGESFCYADVVCGVTPDPDSARAVLERLLRN